MRSSIWQRFVATSAILALGSVGMEPLLARDSRRDDGIAALKRTLAQTSLDLPANRLQLDQARREATKLVDSPNAKIAARAKRTILVYSIATAKTAEQRHKLIQELPVKVNHSADAEGTVATFSARGKERLRLTVPPTAIQVDDSVSGPSAEAARKDDCYDGPGDCATWEEMADAAIVVADTLAQLESDAADAAASGAEYDDFCSNNPGMCDGDKPFFTSGPSADSEGHFGCLGEIVAAAGTAAASAATVTGFGIALETAAVPFSQGLLWGILGSTLGLGAATGLAVAVAGYCVYRAIHVREPGEFVDFRTSLMF